MVILRKKIVYLIIMFNKITKTYIGILVLPKLFLSLMINSSIAYLPNLYNAIFVFF